MVNYYEKHYGNLYPGDIAKSSDINQIQQNIQDALKNAIRDLTEGESWILGTNDQTDKTDEIVIINPKDGRVEGVIDCRGLLPDRLRAVGTDVLNGIAYDSKTGKIYLTGKNWPKLYEVKLIEK